MNSWVPLKGRLFFNPQPGTPKVNSQPRRITAFVLLCGLCLSVFQGCTVGPDFRTPKEKAPPGWHGLSPAAAPGKTAITSQPVELAEWWSNFDDPLLTSLVERAMRANLDLLQAQSRIRQARASLGVTTAGFWPEVDVNAQFRRSFASVPSGSDSAATSSTLAGSSNSAVAFPSSFGPRNFFQAGLDASWELDFFGGTRRNIEASKADLEAAVMDKRDVFVTLVSEVATNYANLRQFQKQIEIAGNNLKAQQHSVDITTRRHEAGFVSALDVANARAQAATTASQIPVLESSARVAIYNLSVLLGLEPVALEEELSTPKPTPPTPPEIPAGLPSDLLRRRPDIRKAEAQAHAATARIGVATADLFPKFSLTGSFGFSGSDLSQVANWGTRFWSWGPSVTWPIFTAGRIMWNIEVQNEAQQQALLNYQKTILTALKDVETALVSYSNELQHNKYLKEAAENNRRAVDLSMKLYVEGKTDFLNVLNAQRSLFLSEDALAQSTNSLTTDLIALYKALGGGWEKTEKHEPENPSSSDG